jgi:hypothetical protein
LSHRKRRILLVASFCLAFGVVLVSLHRAIEAAQLETVQIQSDAFYGLGLVKTYMHMDRKKGINYQALILGDSMILPGLDMQYGDTIPSQITRKLRDGAPPGVQPKLYRMAVPGAGYSVFYFFADEIVRMRPRMVVYEFNANTLSDTWHLKWARADNVSRIGFEHIPEALMLPLDRLGVTVDRILWTVACVELRCGKLWNRIQRAQLSVAELYLRARGVVESSTGWRANERMRNVRLLGRRSAQIGEDRSRRRTAEQYREVLDTALDGAPPDHMAFQLLAATIRRLVDAGIPVLVYATPLNVESIRERGVWNPVGMQQTMTNLADVVHAAGGRFVDLHDLLPDDGFRDAASHMTFRGKGSGQDLLADRLAPLVLEEIEAAQARMESRRPRGRRR